MRLSHWSTSLAVILILSAGNLAEAAEPLAAVSANQLTFASQPRGIASAAQIVTITNNGAAELTISEITVAGENAADFVETNNCPLSPSTLAPKAFCELRVVFRPSASGERVATISISDNASGSPQSVALKGVATEAAPVATFAPGAVSFGRQAIGTSSAQHVIVLTNTGSAPLSISSAISLDGPAHAEFRLSRTSASCPDGGELAPGARCEIAVIFAPASEGAKNAQVTLLDNAAGNPHAVSLSGTGAAAQGAPPPSF
ncbi:MAG: choice-of-anchor D domain-containing protein [Acidipila sp.]|nr:choice-of-anchor D domain-containing protein [Acidipila sp.]